MVMTLTVAANTGAREPDFRIIEQHIERSDPIPSATARPLIPGDPDVEMRDSPDGKSRGDLAS
jgi:hypothetical protein